MATGAFGRRLPRFDGTGWRPGNLSPAVPPHRRRVPWWAAALVVVGALVLVAALAVPVWGLWAYANGDHLYIDGVGTEAAAAAGCADVVKTIEAAPGDVEAGNAAIDRLVAGVQATGESAIDRDEPVRAWLRDWRDLEDARTAAGQTGSFVVPRTDDDYPITTRMVDIAPEPCENAVALAAR